MDVAFTSFVALFSVNELDCTAIVKVELLHPLLQFMHLRRSHLSFRKIPWRGLYGTRMFTV